MAIFENVKNICYRYQCPRLQLINLNYSSVEILLSYLLTARRSFPYSLLLRQYNEPNITITSNCCRSYATPKLL